MSLGRTVVLGVGNLLLRDEGVGIHAVRRLTQEYRLPAEVEVVDGGCAGYALFEVVARAERVVVVDALLTEAPAGTMFRFRPADLDGEVGGGVRLSLHDVGILEVLQAAQLLGHRPEVVILGVQPADVSPFGVELSPVLAGVLPELVERLAAELAAMGHPVARRGGADA